MERKVCFISDASSGGSGCEEGLVMQRADQRYLVVLSTVSLPSQGWFVPTFLRPVFGIVTADVMAAAWSSCS